jgi:hypothetical protein
MGTLDEIGTESISTWLVAETGVGVDATKPP